MKINLIRYSLAFALFIITISTAWAGEVEEFVGKLKIHYQKSPSLEVFSLNYHYLGGGDPYQSWDYQSPDRYIALRMVEIDLIKMHFVENDIHHFPDGVTVNRVQFQNDTESFFYDKNGISLGKRVIKQSMDTFQELKGHIFLNVDFLAVTPLLEESNVMATIKLHRNKISGQTTLTHTTSDDNEIDYTFSDSPVSDTPIRLMSINNKSQRKIYVYDDYQTTKGITFARSILKYYDDSIKPSFIHRIDQLHVLEKIDPIRLQVPKEFGPIIPERDRTLVSEEIAKDLYLVTDSYATRNSLFKVNEDEIMVFGAAVSRQLAEQTINLIQSQFPKKKITSVYVTHPHSDHIAGLTVYAKRGIVIRADTYTIAAIKAYPHFATDIATFKFQPIEHEQLLDGAHFYVLESTRSKRQGFVYFKDSGIIFQSDFLFVAFEMLLLRSYQTSAKPLLILSEINSLSSVEL